MRESNWYGIDVCISCERRLYNEEKMSSLGVCPKCGYSSGSTICETKKVVLKEIKHHEWWQFWKRKSTFKGKDEFSERWANGLKTSK